jgi:hypothetical protein
MSNVESAIIPGIRITSTWRLAASWIGASAIAVPIGVLLHELGHLLVYIVFGFQGVALHYNSATYAVEKAFWQQVYRGNVAAAASMTPLWKVGVATIAGLLVTCVVTLVCCAVAKKSAHPFVIALGIFASARFLSGISTIPAALSGRFIRSGTDEAHLAVLTGIPILLLIFAGLLFLVLAWIWLFRSIPKDQRWVSLGSLISGLVLGIVIYFWGIGIWLLP